MKTIHKILIGLGIVVALVVAGGFWLYSSLDTLVAQAIRKYGSEVTGVAVNVASVKLVPSQGKGSLRGLSVGNPKGFDAKTAFKADDIDLELDIASLTKDVIVVKRVDIIAPEVTYELTTHGNNFEAIQRNIETNLARMGGGGKSEKAGKGGGKKIVIEELRIHKGRVAARSALLGQDKALEAALPEIVIRDIGRKSGGATAQEIVHQIWGPLREHTLRAVASLDLGGATELLKKGGSGAKDALRGLFK